MFYEFFARLLNLYTPETDEVQIKIKVNKKNQKYDAICRVTVHGYWKLKSHWTWKPLGKIGDLEGDSRYHNKNLKVNGKWRDSHHDVWLEYAYRAFLKKSSNERNILCIPVMKAAEDIKSMV